MGYLDDMRQAARDAFDPAAYVHELAKLARGRSDVRGRLRALAELRELAGYGNPAENKSAPKAEGIRRTKFRGFLRSSDPEASRLPPGHRRRTAPKPRPTPEG